MDMVHTQATLSNILQRRRTATTITFHNRDRTLIRQQAILAHMGFIEDFLRQKITQKQMHY